MVDIIFTKNDFWHYFYAKFHTFFVKYIFEKKKHFELHLRAYTNMGFQSYAVYKVNNETYSLDKLADSQYCKVA